MSGQEILYTTADRVATITLNRPGSLNAWTPRMDVEVYRAICEADREDNVRAVVITGAGRGFCAGADFSWLDDLSQHGSGAQRRSSLATDGTRSERWLDPTNKYAYFHGVGKPLIAAINGPAVGLGLTIALYCDFRFASTGAKLSTGFSKRGLIAEFGTAWLMPRLVGLSNAVDLLFSSRTIDADEALRIGLVNQVFPQDVFMAQVYDWAARLTSTVSPRSLRVIKKQLHDGLSQSLFEAINISEREMALSVLSEDFREGIAHFREKRAPRFSGKS
jgi:enoyl-CoA hydratase/carnithine racemase